MVQLSKSIKFSIALGYLSVFIDLLGVSVLLPVIPFLALELGASSFDISMIFAGYAGAQMLSTPISGKLSDRFGRKRMLILSLTGSCVGFLLQGLVTSVKMFIVARFVAGIFGGSIPIVQAFIADVVPPQQRASYFARLGSVITVAFMFGPGIGAGLSQFTLQTPMLVASGLAGLGVVLAVFLFKEPARPPPKARSRSLPSSSTADATTAAAADDDVEKGAARAIELEPLTPVSRAKVESVAAAASSAAASASASAAAAAPSPRVHWRLVWLMWLVALLNMLGFSAWIYASGLFLLKTYGWGSCASPHALACPPPPHQPVLPLPLPEHTCRSTRARASCRRSRPSALAHLAPNLSRPTDRRHRTATAAGSRRAS